MYPEKTSSTRKTPKSVKMAIRRRMKISRRRTILGEKLPESEKATSSSRHRSDRMLRGTNGRWGVGR